LAAEPDLNNNILTLPETIFDSSLLLSPHTLLLGLLFHHVAFDAPTLTSLEHLSKLDIHPDDHELPLPLKQSMNDIFVFRRATKTGMNAYVLSANEQITYNMISGWTKKLGELAGFGVVVILYTLHYNAGNEFDQCCAYICHVKDRLIDEWCSEYQRWTPQPHASTRQL
jgi:hypothetical protein